MSHNDYKNDWPSVTQVLDGLRKPGLENWFKYNTIEFIKAESEKGKTVGKQLHEIVQAGIEQEALEIRTDYPDELRAGLGSFSLFKKEHPEIKLKKAEMSIEVDKYKYNMTLDALATETGRLIVFDWKTGKAGKDLQPKIYEEMWDQLAAYFMGYNSKNKPGAECAGLVVLAKDKIAYTYQLLTKEFMAERFENIFLPALTICKYKKTHQTWRDDSHDKNKSRGREAGTDREGQAARGDSGKDNGRGNKGGKLPDSF